MTFLFFSATMIFLTCCLLAIESRSTAKTFEDGEPMYLDRQCGGNLTNLWLDVVLVVDDSRAVSSTEMENVKLLISSVFSNGTRIGENAEEPRTTRIGLTTYNTEATIVADLNKFQSFLEFNSTIYSLTVSSSGGSVLLSGLEAAVTILQRSETAKERENYKKVILIFSPLHEEILLTLPLVHRLRADGVEVIAVDKKEGSTELQKELLQINCFCPAIWTQLRASYSDHRSFKYGTCMILNTLPAAWRAARLSCRNQFQNAHLLNEYDINKHNYVLEMFKNSSTTREPYTYHIGLSLSSGQWCWEQSAGKDLIRVDWTNWSQGYPIISSTATVALNKWSDGVATWQNTSPMGDAEYYVCQVDACDTDNYCETEYY